MPRVKVFYPEGMFADPAEKNSFMDEVASAVAAALSCRDYNDELCRLKAEEIDIFSSPFSSENARLGKDLAIEIMGFDYPSRMGNIEDRLVEIKGGISGITLGRKASVSFIGIAEGCWV